MTYYFTEFGEWDSIVKARKSVYSVISDHYKSTKGMSRVTIYRMGKKDKVVGYVNNVGDTMYWRKDDTSSVYILNPNGTLGKIIKYNTEDLRKKRIYARMKMVR